MGSGNSTANRNSSQNNNQSRGKNNESVVKKDYGNDAKEPVTKQDDERKSQFESEKMAANTQVASTSGSTNQTKKVSGESVDLLQSSNRSIEKKEDEEALPEDQQKFDTALRFACCLTKPESVTKYGKSSIETLELHRALPHTISLFVLTSQLKHLQILNISGNQLGPSGFCAVILSLCQNSTITTLNIADNQTDTDCAVCIGEALSSNQTLTCLDVSGNYLGKDYFSRCVGPALAKNSSLKVLKCESIGGTDFAVLGEHLKQNKSLVSLNVNSNELSNAKPFIQGVAQWIKASDCVESIEIKTTGLKSGHVQFITDALKENKSLNMLNISANQVSSSTELLNLVIACACHLTMTHLIADDLQISQVDSWKSSGPNTLESVSKLQQLSLSGCNLKDDHFSSLLQHLGEGRLSSLYDIHVGNNPDITTAALKSIQALTHSAACSEETSEEEVTKVSSLKRLNLGHNNAEPLVEFLMEEPFSDLEYLNLRRAKISGAIVGKLQSCIYESGLGTLVLDGIKFSGTDALQTLFSDKPKLMALSLSSCQLNDADLQPLWNSMKSGLPMTMIKLSANRVTDGGVCKMCEALQAHKTHPLALIDLSSNNVSGSGAKRLSELLLHKKHKSQIHTINMADNNIDSDGVTNLVSCVTKSSLLSLNVSNQSCSYGEEDMDKILNQVTKTLGLKLVTENGATKPATTELPQFPSGISIKLQSLGGETGELGPLIDSMAISTDYSNLKIQKLTLQNAFELAAVLKNCESADCLLSSAEWSRISRLDKDAPSWLKVASQRSRALYMTGLPASITTQKMEGLLEMEADCNVDEVCLMKDTVTRKNNGLAWILMSDEASVDRAVQFYNNGEAKVFSQPFTISRLNVKIDDNASTEADAKAKQDMERRLAEKKKDQDAHDKLIQRAYVESQARHAYRLANPAYADGRIW